MQDEVSLRIDIRDCRYHAMIGTGGIGTGSFFALRGNHTLGREESRSGRFMDRKDYCKLHIVSHYVKTLLGSGFSAFPIGMIGDDDAGRTLHSEMEHAGLDLRYVGILQNSPTLFSFCFIYPDDSGGNMTTDDSASSRVSGETIAGAEEIFKQYGSRGVGLAVPEVPLEARHALLDMATTYGLFRVASFTAGEIRELGTSAVYKHIDLLALNLEELRQLSVVAGSGNGGTQTTEESMERVYDRYPHLQLTVTDGSRGSWSWDGHRLVFQPAARAEVISTAGAGDAFLAGVISGLTAGLPLAEAQQLGTMTGSLSVTSPHTIHKGVNRISMISFLRESGYAVSPAVARLID
jgi:sugar/nucleoside kinase (ribokinase family)